MMTFTPNSNFLAATDMGKRDPDTDDGLYEVLDNFMSSSRLEKLFGLVEVSEQNLHLSMQISIVNAAMHIS